MRTLAATALYAAPFVAPLIAAPSAALAAGPVGLYCSCPPTNGVSHSVHPDIAALPYVDGTLLRIGWRELEPSPGVYDWSLLDAELARAETHDTDVALGVVLGSQIPAWLEAEGAQVVEYVFRDEPGETVAPWDQVFLGYWTDLIAELGARYDGHARIKLVHITSSTGNGFEMQLFGPLQTWEAAGYTTAAHIGSWQTVMDAFDAAFPATPLDVEVHPVLGSDEVAEAVAAYGRATIGDRFGVFAAWWTEHNAHDVYPGMYDILLDAAAHDFAAVQVARSETVHGADSFGVGGLAGTLQLALDSGARYAEVWNADLLNPELTEGIQAFAAALDAGEPCTPADLAEPRGVLDLADISTFTTAFVGSDPIADLNGDGVYDLADLGAFVESFVGGCG